MEQSGEATQNFASIVSSVGGGNVGGHPVSIPNRAATPSGAGHHDVPAKMAETAAAVTPSLALLDSVLAMAPSHQTALRCRASTLARLGRAPEALVAADRAVSAAEAAVRAAEVKGKDPGPGCTSEIASASASTNIFLPPFRPATASSAGGENLSGRRHHSDAPTSAGADLGASAKARAVKNGDAATVGSGRGGGENCGVRQWSCTPKSIGFMRSSKVNLVVGGLLLTGGGRASTLDVAKSLVLRGCLRQKMGRRKQAEDDYRRALRTCHNRLREIESGLGNHRTELDTDSNNGQPVALGGDRHGASAQRRRRRRTMFGEGCEGRTGGQSNFGDKEGAAHGGKGEDVLDDASSFSKVDVTKPLCVKDPTTFRGTSEVCKDAVNIGDFSDHHDGRCEVLKLESLIHHNLATVHLATVLGTDNRVSFHKVRLFGVQDRFFRRALVSICFTRETNHDPPPSFMLDLTNQAAIAREASEFVACQEQATARCTARQPPAAAHLQSKHEGWWHSTVLAVAHMVSTTGLGAVPWRGTTTIDNNSNNPGRSARLQLGSAEIAAKLSSGYDGDDPQVCVSV